VTKGKKEKEKEGGGGGGGVSNMKSFIYLKNYMCVGAYITTI